MSPSPSSSLRALGLAAAASLLLAACGDGGGAGAVEVPDTDADVAVVGTDNLQWSSNALEAGAGEISVSLTCQGGVNHNFVVEGVGEVAECAPGQTDEGTVELDAGEYVFLCTIPGHERSMRGTLTVE